ncbi:MAG: alpha/beta hydrolase [Thermoplasmatota archaeon]
MHLESAFNAALPSTAVQPVEFTVEGETVRGEWHAPERPRSALVLLHGLNSSTVEFGGLPGRLSQAGYAVLAFDQRGFGQSGGERGLTSLARATADAHQAARFVEHRTDAPIGVLGHSLGGLYAVAAMAQSNQFRFGVLAHPLNRVWDELNAGEKAGYHVLGRMAERRMRHGKPAGSVKYQVHYKDLFVSREAAEAAQRPPMLLHRANLANYRLALEARGTDWAPKVKVPVLTVWSRHDRVVDPRHSRLLHDALGGPKELFEHQGGHSCFRDVDGPMVATGIERWLAKREGAR